jgi:hypothetical protein
MKAPLAPKHRDSNAAISPFETRSPGQKIEF